MGASGVINGGIYLINKALCEAFLTQEKFSFEKDFLEKNTDRLHMQSFISESFFIDIGIPEDYQKAQQTFHQFNTWHVQPNWTLFLDRDGVVNKKIENGYVTHWDKFEFLPHTFQALALAKKYFKRIVLVTNQQCVGKQIISENELNAIHDFMLKEIQLHGGNIDAIYVAPQLAKENHQDRKPGIGMPLKAQIDFPEIDFQQSIICGDSISDMEMGASLGMKKIFIGAPFCNQADATFKNLSDAIDFFINIAN
ncbi:MAG: HAD-IIIA family hydrolase [Chitinophagaceae bacterium]